MKKKYSHYSLIIKLILLTAFILLSFGVTGYFLSDHLIKKAKLDYAKEIKAERWRPPPGERRGFKPPRKKGPRGPDVFGMTPEALNSLIFAFSLILGFICCSIMLILLSRKTAQTAEQILKEIKEGNLSVRFPISKLEPPNSIAVQFNEMANEIEKLVTNIKESEKNKSYTFQELAHDIRTPVTGLMSLIETIHEFNETMSKEQLKEFAGASLAECKYISRLVEDLLFISGVEQVKFIENFSKVDLYNIISIEASLFTNKNIEILCRDEEYSVLGDAYLLKRLVRNSLENATSFAKSKVTVDITDKDKEHFEIVISDDGPGLHKDALEMYGKKSFSRKERESDRDQKRFSIGLGSYIISKITNLHRGQLEIHNIVIEGKQCGAQFKVSLPKYLKP